MSQTELHIFLKGKPPLLLKFSILDNPLSRLWLERMDAKSQYPLDHVNRFYGFGTRAEELKTARDLICKCIEIINSHQNIILRPFTNVDDQDCLNYLHNIFERYHGLLDKQDHEFWNRAPDAVRKALAELNLAVHRCETASKTPQPRFVCTWFGLPKTKILSYDIMNQFGVLSPPFGSVCLNYVEIGKTLEDLAADQDNYIGSDAFQPFSHYSADFVVRFADTSTSKVELKIQKMREYHSQHLEFFQQRGLAEFNDPRLLPLRFPVAQLIETCSKKEIIKQISSRQEIEKVWIE